MKKNINSILFLCNHNVIRSPMAEYLFKAKFGETIFCQSAGVSIGQVDGFVVAVMAEIGIDLQNHQPKMLGELAKNHFDLIITHSPQAHHVALSSQAISAGEVLYWPAADPTAIEGSRVQRLDAYRHVRNSIENRLVDFFKI